MYTQYLWAAEQAVEKYLKCILMLNRHNTKNLGHKVERVLGAVRACLRVELKLTEVEQQAFDNLVRWDADRYLIRSYHVEQVELAGLDLLVWRLRQYCEPLDVNHYADDPSQDLLKVNLAEIEGRALHPSKAGHVSGGELEKILEEKRHPARTGLIWHNLRYNNANRRSTRMSPGWRLVNSPLDMAYDQAVINDAERWMRLA
ncbi:hypothetical protein [Xanthomonas citri]|uniref:hypothetical protein n=1 Tax=Xanthomonas citri TaxID=346 RepID=UPI002227ACD8|nr:hypothetical protein [Xanthomonas citri]MCW3194011.1 hypothetical protein [Xanthomonas citri pv. fuscans]